MVERIPTLDETGRLFEKHLPARLDAAHLPALDGDGLLSESNIPDRYAGVDGDGRLAVNGNPVTPAQVGVSPVSEIVVPAVDMFNVHGAAGPTPTHLNGVPVLRYSKNAKVADSFNRADNAAAIGNLESGQAWVTANGTWGISGNNAYTSASTGAARITATGAVDGGTEVTVAALPTAANSELYILRRFTDASNYVAASVRQTGRVQILHNVAGTITILATLDATVVVVRGDKIRFESYGTTLSVFRNNVLVGTATTTVTAGTGVGVRHSDTDNSVRIGDFVSTDIDTASALVTIPADWSNYSVALRFLRLDVSTGSVIRWRYLEAPIDLGATAATTLATVGELSLTGVPTTAGTVQEAPMGITRPRPTDGEVCLGVSRVAAAVGDTTTTGDTITGPVGLLSVVLRKAA